MKTHSYSTPLWLFLLALPCYGQIDSAGDSIAPSNTSPVPPGAQQTVEVTNFPPAKLGRLGHAVLKSPVRPQGEIEVQVNGARAGFAQHKAFFAPNPNTMEAVHLAIPDRSSEIVLKSHVVGIGYWDSVTGDAVLFATPQDSIGEVSGSTVRYTNALEGTDAEITYTYTWDSFDQTVILRKKVPEPAALNMTGDPAKIRLVVITEFIDPPEPIRVPNTIDLSAKNKLFGIQGEDSIPDETLFFGSMRMAGGKMLLLGDSSIEVPSGKTFLNVEGSHYLVEFCPWLLVKALVDSLPAGTLHAKVKARGDIKSLIAQIPKPRAADRNSPKMRLAQNSSLSAELAANKSQDAQPGVVLDYLLVTTHLIDVDFSGGTLPYKQGPAAVGQYTNDFWINWPSSYGSLANLTWSDQSGGSGIGLVVSNAPGGWGNGSSDIMYNSYLYGSPGGTVTLTLTNLPNNVYNFYLYGHEQGDANASFKLFRGGQQIAYKGTTLWENPLWGTAWNSTNWEPGMQYQVFKNIAVTNQTILIQIPPGGNTYPYINGLQIVESAAVPTFYNSNILINVNFGNYSSNKIGFAAVGLATNDYWNGYYNPSNPAGAITGLTNANGFALSAGLTILNAAGVGNWTVNDGMYGTFSYATNGGNVSLLITNLPGGAIYDFYLYGHGSTNDANTVFQLWSGGRDCDVRGTTIWGSGYSNSITWDESQQYIVFHDVPVYTNETVTIVAGHDPYGFANLNGLQIVFKGSTDTNLDGLPDLWKWYYFGATSTSGTNDYDSDHLTNFREFQLGIDPTHSDTDGNGVADGDDSERVWIEDMTPTRGIENDSSAASSSWSGAFTENWNWTGHWSTGWNGSGANAYSYFPYSSCHCFHVSDTHSGIHQHWFDKSVVNMMANNGEVLITYVNIDPNNVPGEIMLQWYTTETNGLDSWEHRAYWGSNNITWGTDNTASRWYVTNLPTAGTWKRLEVPASAVGLEGKVIQGMAFTLYNGRAAFDHAGKFIPDLDGNGLTDAWEKFYFSVIGQDPNGDPDHDGLSNLDELRGGTNPTNCNPPQISGQPQNTCGYLGGSAYFFVTPTGSVLPNYRFQWRLGGTNINSATNNTFVVTNVQSTNLGNYTVVITNVCGSITSSVATLTFCPPPYVQITLPTNNTTFTAPAVVSIQATATNTDSSITNVQFYRSNLALLGNDTAPPYSYVWNAAAGLYSLTAIAYDSHGLISTSSPVTLTVGSACSYTNNTYSSNNAFGNGFLMNLNYTNAQGRLQLNSQATPFNFISIACNTANTNQGTLVRVDTLTGQPVGEYHTAPETKASFPGHVAVDRYGNTWVANWKERGYQDGSGLGSITKIGVVIGGTRGDIQTNQFGVVTNFVANTNGHYLKPPFTYCTAIDRNGDGYIKTSIGAGDVLAWPTNSVGGVLGSVLNADDECIINYVRVPAQLASTLAIDANNDVWVGGYCADSVGDGNSDPCGNRLHVKVNGITGQVFTNTQVIFTNAGTAYGGFEGIIGQNGFLWSSGGANSVPGNRSLVVFDPVTQTNLIMVGTTNGNYGMDIDPLNGNVWVATYDASNVVVYSKTGARLTNYAHGDTYGSGVAIDNNSNVWVSHGPFNGAINLARMRTDGSSLTLFSLQTNTCPGVTPAREVCFDSAGKVWTLCASSPHVLRVNPISGQVEVCLQLGDGHQARGDLTGYKLLSSTAPSGVWSVIYTNGATNQAWGTLTWTASTSDTNQIRVEVRAANTYGQLSTNSFQFAYDSVPLTNVVGQLLEIRVTIIKPAGASASPWLHDLTVDCSSAAAPSIQITSPTNNQVFILSPTNILITATGSSLGGTITNVGFYVGSTLIGQTNQTPYQCLWTNVGPGTYTLTAKATNNYGLWAISPAVTNIIVNAMPKVTFLQPVTNTTAYFEVTNVLLQVTNYDADGTVTSVVFRCSNTNIAGTVSSNNSVWSLYWSNRFDAEYAITAVATDNRGASSTSDIRVFKVNPTNQPPFVWITYPTNNAVFPEGVDLTITANASNRQAGATVTNVEFFVNRASIGSDPDAPYAVSKCCWKAGTYVIIARATDSFGASYVSAPITNTVVKELLTGGGFWDTAFQIGTYSSPYQDECGYELRLDENPAVFAMTSFGSKLYVSAWESARYFGGGGAFDQPAASLYIRDGTNWSRSGAVPASCHDLPFNGQNNPLGGIAVNSSGTYVAGFNTNSLQYVVKRWDGTNWTKLGDYFDLNVFPTNPDDSRMRFLRLPRLQFVDADLFLYGNFANHADANIQFIAKWNATSNQWQQVGAKLNAPVFAIAELKGKLIVGGLFTNASGVATANCIAQLNGTNWSSLGNGVGGVDYYQPAYYPDLTNESSGVFSLAACDTNLFVGGDFTYAGDKTNANGIAVWNGAAWSTIGNGLLAKDGTFSGILLTNPLALTISPHGNSAYVGGVFSRTLNSASQSIPVGSIAKAVWSEDSHEWNWFSLDYGVYGVGIGSSPTPADALYGSVAATTIINGTDPGAYDVIVGGYFRGAGSVYNQDYLSFTRWRVGYPQPPSAPLVVITNPVNLTFYTNVPATIDITAIASSSYTNIDSTAVEFFVDGASIGDGGDNGNGSWTATWYSPTPGPHLLTATAKDLAGLKGQSSPVLINIIDTNSTVKAVDDFYVIMADSPPVTLNVLTNDTPAGKLRLLQVYPAGGNGVGTISTNFNGSSLIYRPTANRYGTDIFIYEATDGTNITSAFVTIKVRVPPFIALQYPIDQTNLAASSSVAVSGATFGYDTSVTNVTVYVNGSQIQKFTPANVNYQAHPTNFFFNLDPGAVSPQSMYAFFSTNWSTNLPGYYTFQAKGIDSYGYTNSSDLVTVILTNSTTGTNRLIATIDNLPQTVNDLGTTNYPIVRDGLFELLGKARDPIATDPVSYQVLLLRPEDNQDWDPTDPQSQPVPFANVTPPPLDPAGFHPGGDVTNSDGASSLQRLDLSGVPNGTYDLLLTVHGGGSITNTSARFRLDTQLKIGQFSFSEQDLVIPVNGIPLTVTRTYNSLNPRSADFGFSWTYALNSMDIELDEQRQDITIGGADAPFADDEEDDNGLPKVVSIRTGGGWDVTLTLPDGRRTTFAFDPWYSSDDLCYHARWTPPSDVHYGLTIRGSDLIVPYPLPMHWQEGGSPATLENHDVRGWVLTNFDGTQFSIDRGDANNVTWDNTGDGHFINVQAYGPPKLTSILQRSGDLIQITDTGIFHFAGSNGVPTTNLTRSSFFARDQQGRIIEIRDPISGSNGLAVVRYVYNQDTGNLIQVQRLTDRVAGIYTTNKYHYDNSNFPHYITSIEDPRGVPLARNEYDDSGRLTAVVDANGNRTQFYHSTSNRLEVVVDRLGRTNSHAYDFHGNVTASTNAMGEYTLMSYDTNNDNLLSTTDSLGHTTSYTYDDKGNRTTVVNALNRTNFSTYSQNGDLTGTKDPLGNWTTNLFDEFGNLTNTVQKDANGVTVGETFSGYNGGFLVETRDANGNTNATFTYDGAGNLLSATDNKGFTHTFGYDSNGNQTNTTYTWTGSGVTTNVTTRTEYDAQGRVTMTVDAVGNTNRTFYTSLGKVDYTVDKLGNTNRSFYDARGNVVQNIGPDGLSTQTVYNEDGQPIYTTDRNGISGTRMDYDLAGRVTNAVRLTNITIVVTAVSDGIWSSSLGSVPVPYSTNATEYFENGWVKSRTGPDGQKTSYTYYDDGQIKTVTDALTNITTYAYDAAGRQQYVADALNHTNQFIFDAVGRDVKTIFADNTFITNIFDLLGQQVGKGDQANILVSNIFSVSGQLTGVVMPSVPDPEGGTNAQPTWTYGFNQYSQQITTTDYKGRVTTNTFDPFGRQVALRLPLGQTNYLNYDGFGRISNRFDFKGQRELTRYDRLGRVGTNFWFAAGTSYPSNSTEYYYNTLGQLTNIIERFGTNASSSYVATMGFPVKRYAKVSPWPMVCSYTRKYAPIPAGILLSALALLALPQRTRRLLLQFYFCGGWRLSHIPVPTMRRLYLPSLWHRSVSLLLIVALFASDPKLEILWTARADCSPPPGNDSTDITRFTFFAYDFDGHLTQVNSPEGTINYEYELATGWHTGTCTTNSYVQYAYDELGRLKTVKVLKRNAMTVSPNETTTYTYTAVGNRQSVTFPSGIVTTYQYDALNRLTNLTHSVGGTNLLASYSYQLHPTGRRTNALEVIKQDTGSYLTNTLSWQFDAMYRLTNEVSISSATGGAATYTNSYQYDKVGNRFAKIHYQTNAVTTITNQFNDNDQLLKEVTKVGSSLTETNWYTYDANGSLIGKTNVSSLGTGTAVYGYNLANKLSSVTTNGTTTTFLYNDAGMRVRSTTSGSSKYYLIDANNHTGYAQVLEELSTLGAAPTTSYVIGDDVLGQSRIASGTARWFLSDGHGSTRQLSNPAAGITSDFNYDAYGITLANSSTSGETTKLYCGEQFDSTLGMYNLRARYYSPYNGTFAQRDSFVGYNDDPLSLHKYTYCSCDPISHSDPSGQMGVLDILSTIGIILTIVSFGIHFSSSVYAFAHGDPKKGSEELAWTIVDVLSFGIPLSGGLSAAKTGAELALTAKSLLQAGVSLASVWGYVDAGLMMARAAASGSSGGGGGGGGSGPGKWVRESNRGRSKGAIKYEADITGHTGEAYLVDEVKFDGVNESARKFLEAKGRGYEGLFRFADTHPNFKFKGADTLRKQLISQAAVAKNYGYTVDWYVAEQYAAEKMQAMVTEEGIQKYITVIFKAPQ